MKSTLQLNLFQHIMRKQKKESCILYYTRVKFINSLNPKNKLEGRKTLTIIFVTLYKQCNKRNKKVDIIWKIRRLSKYLKD